MIDPAKGCFEIFKATNKLVSAIQDLFHNNCLVHYPCPQFTLFDNEGKFKHVFKQMCANYVIKAKPTTTHFPQAIAIIERVHKVVNDIIRSFDLEKENLEEDNPYDYFL